MVGMRKSRLISIIKVAKFIESNPNTHLREISRQLIMNPAIVHRALGDIEEFLVTRSFNEEIGSGIPNMPVLVRLKENVTTEGILKFLKVKNMLEEVKE